MGGIRANHRVLLKLPLGHIDELNIKITQLEEEIEKLQTPFDEKDVLQRLATIPGVDRKVAQITVAEIGIDMSRFPNTGHLASWAGLTPGKNESAGHNRSSRTLKANRYLRPALVQAAHAVGRSKDNFLAAKYRSLAGRRGKQRAAIAVAHKILKIAYHIIRDGEVYQERGANYLDERNRTSVIRRSVKRLEKLGFKVVLESAA